MRLTELVEKFKQKLFEPIYPTDSKSRALEVEISTHCVSKCFACPRTQNDPQDLGWNAGLMDLENLKGFLQKSAPFRRIILCGAYGDPIYHTSLIDFVHWLHREIPGSSLYIETNGSHKSADWWRQLAASLEPQDQVSFSIDGLADTNVIYRKNTKWETIITGVETLRQNSSCFMSWKWILFRHNEHQVREAFALSKKLGFNEFKIIESVRHNDETRPRMDLHQIQDLGL